MVSVMVVERHELVKEIRYFIDCLEHPVFGRIYKSNNENNPYTWDISHHYRPGEAAGVYYPSTLSAPSLEEAEQLLESYAGSFANIDVKKNETFAA